MCQVRFVGAGLIFLTDYLVTDYHGNIFDGHYAQKLKPAPVERAGLEFPVRDTDYCLPGY